MFYEKQKVLKVWINLTKKILHERELAEYEAFQKRQLILEGKADKKWVLWMLKLGIKGLKKNAQTNLAQKEIEA